VERNGGQEQGEAGGLQTTSTMLFEGNLPLTAQALEKSITVLVVGSRMSRMSRDVFLLEVPSSRSRPAHIIPGIFGLTFGMAAEICSFGTT
jgi:hypothetical protein